MNLVIPPLFVPSVSSPEMQKLRHALASGGTPIEVPVITDHNSVERDCYANVRSRVDESGGKMLIGWAIWQHGYLFIEAEPHAVYEFGEGKGLIDCTPHAMPDGSSCGKILFIPNEGATYDFDSPVLQDNFRVPLVDDQRVLEALRLFAERTRVMNTVPGVNVVLPPDVSRRVSELDRRASILLSQALERRVGRNDPCPCGSGKKYKKCHEQT